MTSVVKVTAHPGSGVNRVQVDLVHVDEKNTELNETFFLRNGESVELVVFDDRRVVVEEVMVKE